MSDMAIDVSNEKLRIRAPLSVKIFYNIGSEDSRSC